MDKEGMGGGASTYDYGFRIYNSALGRFLSIDPLSHKFAFYSVYQYAGNKPIVAIDLDGLEDVWIHEYLASDGKSMQQDIYYKGEPEYDVWKQSAIETLHLNPKDIPAEGIFTTRQEWNNDGVTFELRTTITPPCIIQANNTFRVGVSKLYNEKMTDFTVMLNKHSDGRTGYEYEDAIQSAAFGVEQKYVIDDVEYTLNIGLYSTNENTIGGFVKVSMDKISYPVGTSSGKSPLVVAPSVYFEVSSQNEFNVDKKSVEHSRTYDTEATIPVGKGVFVSGKESTNIESGKTTKSLKISSGGSSGAQAGMHDKVEYTKMTGER